ncbi:hypothetical protein [Kingella kingae]|uniref:hypothetical protein n=1 Tax=Kingella kingae TaxID=504 RepID=UPI0004279A82|nr:hypothetical protein [Kingella kingae]
MSFRQPERVVGADFNIRPYKIREIKDIVYKGCLKIFNDNWELFMSWIDRELQGKILKNLFEKYGKPCLSMDIFEEICIFPLAVLPMSDSSDLVEHPTDFEWINNLEDKFNKNLLYLIEHQLIEIKKDVSTFETKNFFLSITHKGIDFLEQDGGLSAILNVVTIKLHSDTIRELLEAKIDAANISEDEKNSFKESIKTIKDAALEKLTEKAIEEIPWITLASFLTSLASRF